MASIHLVIADKTHSLVNMPNTTLCELDDIPDNDSRGFVIKNSADNNNSSNDKNPRDATVFVVRQHNTIYVYRNLCPHLGLPLEWMPHQFLDREGQYIQCSTHGALFRIHDGICVSGPCPGESLVPIPFQIQGKSIIIDNSCLE